VQLLGGTASGIGDLESTQKNSDGSLVENFCLRFTATTPYPAGLDFAAQSASDELRKTYLLTPGFFGQSCLGLARQAERYRDTALKQFRSGHLLSVLLCHTQCQGRISLLFGLN